MIKEQKYDDKSSVGHYFILFLYEGGLQYWSFKNG